MIIMIFGAVFMLAVSIFIHELGHLLCGKLVGVEARIFSLGYGKGIWKKRIGKTIYQITAIPIGGYVLFRGDDYSKNKKPRQGDLLSTPPLRRMIPVLGGPFANLVLGFILLFILELSGDSPSSNRIFIEDASKVSSPAYTAGLRTGDRIISINGKKTESFEDIFTNVSLTTGDPVEVTFERAGVNKTVQIVPNLYSAGGHPTIGVMPFGERRVVATFTYGEQLSHFIANLLDRDDKSSAYFQEKIEERKDEIPEELLKQREIQEREKSLRRRALSFLKDGDMILQVAGVDVHTVPELQTELGKHQGKTIPVVVERKTYPLLTPWATETVTIQIPVLGANVFEFWDIRHPKFSELGIPYFRLDSYDAEIENRLSNLKIDNKTFEKADAFSEYLKQSAGRKDIWIGNMKYSADLNLKPIGLLGFRASMKFEAEKLQKESTVYSSLVGASTKVYENVSTTLKGIGMLFSGLLSPKENLSGPIGIVQIAGISLEYGWFTYLDFVAKISLALMVMNLLPIPMADGGHIVLYAYEAITGRPLPRKAIEAIFRLGFFFLIGLGLYVSFNDVMRIF
ncbi:site-2 protease family protein [Leptospira sp. 2 VSF19]|uniref:Site-2 protease family protein n=1 Tax=Leptospira soteropolitanensis TaxID=2950025 RepID=A0AAW5VEQ3_9LEPT|nr:site-2 protease family protein [Leptospira soteropolitanensis]MCW7493390.1 site-2 protease family protein [Leptospira soteropolitanensis]MCW7501078.1 site-2 protease family protein [Leptospira soteropolitanensis]MCW7523242.1 site-2 protease family protein [Leptospira soteropolitanensis]MCW7527103.1 site-2 protease family protein [Leptospira soteropolitanensis]MCW7530960.1 site-2 protease family protein [Leptospira soteropolitanensis]